MAWAGRALVLTATRCAAAYALTEQNNQIPSTMVYEFPADSALVAKFGAMPASSGAFQREQLFHCFSMGADGKPNYVHGTAQG